MPMQIPVFPGWRPEPSPRDLSAALAAAGTLWGTPPVAYPFPADIGWLTERLIVALRWDDLTRWREVYLLERDYGEKQVPASMYATAWRNAVQATGSSVRFRVRANPAKAIWYVRQLLQADAVVAASLELPAPSSYVDWNWPVRIAVAPDGDSDKMALSLRAWIGKEKEWLDPIVKFVDLNAAEPVVDFLFFTSGTGIRSALERSVTPIRANCLFLAGTEPELWDQLTRDIDTVVHLTQAKGVVVGSVDPGSPGPWFTEVIRNLSHNVPLDRALRDTNFNLILAASDPLLCAVFFPEIALRLIRQVGTLAHRGVRVTVDDNMSRHLDMPPGEHPLEIVAGQLGHNLERFRYFQESDEATTISRIARAAEGIQPEPESKEPDLRRLQHRLRWEEPPGRFVSENVGHLIAGSSYTLTVRIGPHDRSWSGSDRPFPEEELPPSESGGHLLTVVFSEPYSVPNPLVSTIFLPGAGPSSTCDFRFSASNDRNYFEGRVIVLHGNRVLQSALLRLDIARDWRSYSESEDEPAFTVETVVRPPSDLQIRRAYGAAILLNHSTDGEPRATRVAGYRPALIPLKGIEEAILRIKDTWDTSNWEDGKFDRMDSAETLELLRNLAIHGRLLYDALVDDLQLEERLRTNPRIQMIAARIDSHLPVEFCYSRRPPRSTAGLCPKAAAALRAGGCPGDCTAPGDEDSVICPLAFWGLSRVIEWHRFDPADRKELDGADFGMLAEPTAREGTLAPLDKLLLAASKKVPEKEIGALVKELHLANHRKPVRAKSWKEWVSAVADEGPATLLLMVHTDQLINLPTMEIADELLDPPYVDAVHVCKPGGAKPLVLLLGCGSGISAVPFQGMPAQFRRKGAAIVVTSMAELLDVHAPKLAALILAELEKSAAGPRTFGDIMLSVKRTCLEKGLPIGLALMTYGDADWWI
jgi:hypothetical protein